MTCNGNTFGTGTNPALTWSGAPASTVSFALVFKDISILSDNDPTTTRLGYHWVIWNIPASTTSLPHDLMSGYHSPSVSGALQWSGRNNYGYFPPCPNPFPASDARFTSCSLTRDSYSYTLYALSSTITPPPPDTDPTTGLPTGNYVVNMGHYIESLTALAVTEIRATSSAWASAFVAPPPLEYPCAGESEIDGGLSFDASAAPDGSLTTDGGLMCLQ